MTTLPAAGPLKRPSRSFIAVGFAFAAVGIAAYVAQFSAGHLKAPWYLPASALLGVACVAVALWYSRSVWRVLALVLLLLVAGGELALLLGSRLPAYTGTQVAAGKPFPAFTTATADGTPFT